MMTDGGCIACHAQPIGGAAAALASRRGWRVDEPDVERSQVTANVSASGVGALQNREGGGLPDTYLYNLFMTAEMNLRQRSGRMPSSRSWPHGSANLGTGMGSRPGRLFKMATSPEQLWGFAP